MTLPDQLEIEPLPSPFDCTGDRALRLPGSKSITNRALVLAALADGPSVLDGVLFSDDTRVMMQALQALGFKLDVDEPARQVNIDGRGGNVPRSDVELFCGNSGTTIRFLTALCALGAPGSRYALTGIPRMLERPIGELGAMLNNLAAEDAPGPVVEFLDTPSYPPIMVHGGRIRGGKLTLQPTLSSQYITAMMMIGPYLPGGLEIAFEGKITSRPYVQMTMDVMTQFAGQSHWRDQAVTVAENAYTAQSFAIEPDASNASYFLAAAAVIRGSRVEINRLSKASVQGDSYFQQQIAAMIEGVEAVNEPQILLSSSSSSSVNFKLSDIDLNDMPDMAQTLAVVALFADGPTTIRNIGNLRVKETDRLAALENELTKLGAEVVIFDDETSGEINISITPPRADWTPMSPDRRVEIETYDDHRMAMAFTVAGLASDRLPGQPRIVILDPACVNKTFPDFFDYIDVLRKAVSN